MTRGLGHVDSPLSPSPDIHGPGRVGRRGAGECGAPGRALPPLPPPPPEAASEPAASGSAEIFLPPSLSAAAPPSPTATTQRPGPLLGHSAPARRGGRRDSVPGAGKARGSQPYASPCLVITLSAHNQRRR